MAESEQQSTNSEGTESSNKYASKSNSNEKRKQKLALRYIVFFIAGASFVPFFGIDFSALSMSILLLLLSLYILSSGMLAQGLIEALFSHPKMLSLWLFWLGCAVFSIIFSPILKNADLLSWVISLSRFSSVLVYFLFGFILYEVLKQKTLNEVLMLKLCIAAFLVLIVNMFLVYLLYPEARVSQEWLNTPAGYSNIRHAGYHAAIICLLCLYFLFPKSHRGLSTLILPVMCLTLVWTFNFWMGGRGSVIAAFLGSLFVLAFSKIVGVKITRLLIGFLFALFCGLVLAEVFAVFDWNGFFAASDRTLIAPNAERLTAGRTILWAQTLTVLDGNYLLGLGANTYRILPGHIMGSHPHNFILQFLVDWGVLGTLAMLLLLATFVFRGLFKNIKANNIDELSIVSGGVIVSLMILGLIDGTLYHTQPTFYLMIAFVFWLRPDQHHSKSFRE
jgi:O-antigen ligase